MPPLPQALFAGLISALVHLTASTAIAQTQPATASAKDRYTQREQDWRNGAIAYQLLLTSFAPSQYLDVQRPLYAPHNTLRPGAERPNRESARPTGPRL